jgi:hypothetical protein
MGSNPIGDAFWCRTRDVLAVPKGHRHNTRSVAEHEEARYANPAERRISNVRGCGFDSLPCYLKNNMRRLGIGEPTWP